MCQDTSIVIILAIRYSILILLKTVNNLMCNDSKCIIWQELLMKAAIVSLRKARIIYFFKEIFSSFFFSFACSLFTPNFCLSFHNSASKNPMSEQLLLQQSIIQSSSLRFVSSSSSYFSANSIWLLS